MYTEQIPELWRFGPVMVADHTRDDTMTGIARRILANAPPKFALVGSSMGGYISFEILRIAPERVVRLGLLDTNARPDLPETSEKRRAEVAEARKGHLHEVVTKSYPTWRHPSKSHDPGKLSVSLAMADEIGVEGFARQQAASITRVDSRPSLGAIRCPTLVLVGEQDQLMPLDRAAEMANGIAGARLVVVPECGHCSTWDQPARVTAALIDLMS
jgi:pimeloyl-ACP methyl ester carboxylesterase